jgi:hypothetical protein
MDEKRILVAMGEGSEAPVVILGMTDASWDDIENGKSQDIDLRPLGIQAILLVMRGTDHDDIRRQLMAVSAGVYEGAELADLSVPPKG